MNRRPFLALTVNLIALIWLPLVATAEDGLYEAPIPADKSLIRFINARLSFETELTLSDVQIDVEPEALSPYQIIDNGAYTLRFNDNEMTADFAAGAFYTIALDAASQADTSIVVIEDILPENPSRSALTFYNFSDAPASLYLELKGDERALFEQIAPGSMVTKALPPIELGVIVRVGDTVVLKEQAVAFTADQHRNVVVLSNTGETLGYITATQIDK